MQPRRWFQIHLLTTIVLMIVASGLVGLNCIQRTGPSSPSIYRTDTHHYGWPWTCYVRTDTFIDWAELHGLHSEWLYKELLLNVAFAIGVLALVAKFCEWFLRRSGPYDPGLSTKFAQLGIVGCAVLCFVPVLLVLLILFVLRTGIGINLR